MRMLNELSSCASQFVIAVVTFALIMSTGGCSPPPPSSPSAAWGNTPGTASGWLDFVDWDKAERKQVVAVEHDSDHWIFMPDPDLEVSHWHLTTDSQNSDRYFVAGIPYVLEMINPSTSSVSHDFMAPDFYKAIATYKVQTVDAEYRTPYFNNFDILPGGIVELYFVPVLPGTYDMWCTIPGHREAGKEGTYTITAGEGFELDLEMAANFDPALEADPRRSESHPVWQEGAAIAQTVVLTESMFDPNEFTLMANVGCKLSLITSGAGEERCFTASEFFQSVVTSKAQDSQAQIKVPYFNAIELLLGGSTELYIVPTVPGTYDVLCTITDHAGLGMTGTITVAE